MIVNTESVTYKAKYNGYTVTVTYAYHVLVIKVVNESIDLIYQIKLTSQNKVLPEFTRFSNEIRARIATGIHICAETPGYDLVEPDSLTVLPWWQKR